MALRSFLASPPSPPPGIPAKDADPLAAGIPLPTTTAPVPPPFSIGSATPSQDVPVQARRRPARLTVQARLGPPLAMAVLVLLVWQAVVSAGLVSSFLLPGPTSVAVSFVQSVRDGILVQYAIPTIEESLLGFALGSVVAVPLGYALAHSSVIAAALEPYLAASQAMPAVALAPLLALWLPNGLPPVIALCALIVFFPAAVNTTLGLRTLDSEVIDAARVDGADGWALARTMELPLALPSILAGLRTSLTLSVTGAVVGEFVVGDQGLGGLLNIARGQFDTPLVFAVLVALALLAAALYGIARLAERALYNLEA